SPLRPPLQTAPVWLPRPVGTHLRKTVHVHPRTFPLFLGAHRLEQLHGTGEVGGNGLLRRREVEPADFRELVVGAEDSKGERRPGHGRIRCRRKRAANSSSERVLSTCVGSSHARRATRVPHRSTSNSSRECESLEMTIAAPRSRARLAFTSLKSSRW